MKTLHLNGIARLGNLIVILMNSVIIALQQNINNITFESYYLLKQNFITINNNNNVQNNVNNEVLELGVYETFHLHMHNKIEYHLDPKHIFEKYIANLIDIDRDSEIYYKKLVLHVRSEDVYTNKCKNYTQPPLYFYNKVIQLENNRDATLVTHDLLSPVGKYLYETKTAKWGKNDLKLDFSILVNCEALAFGFSTLLYPIILFSKKLKRLYLPMYAYKEYLKFKFQIEDILNENQTLILIDLLYYPDIGEYEHTPEAYQQYVEYYPEKENITYIKGKSKM